MEKRNLTYYHVDVFAESKYAGNQLAVFVDAKSISSAEMASIARETNFSETTFITGYNRKNKSVDVRIFTPEEEIPFAGHPTLGTAYIANEVFFEGAAEKIILNLRVGEIPVVRENDLLWMTQVQPKFGETLDAGLMAEILSIDKHKISNKYPIQYVSTGLPFYMVPVDSLNTLKEIKLNAQKAASSLEERDAKELLVFAPEAYSKEDTIACRVFVPSLGIPEDPATGSANGCLAAYLLKHNFYDSSEINLSVAQGFEIGRPSRLYIKASLKEDNYSLQIGGKVVNVAEGRWH